jgi:hypothetical protein
MDEQEYFFKCPYCREPISMLLDASAGAQTYIEDCEVCCRPIQISYEVDQDQIQQFNAGRIL